MDEFAGAGRIDVDGVVVGGGDDSVVGEEEAGDDGGTVCGH